MSSNRGMGEWKKGEWMRGNTVAGFACLSSFHLCTRLVFFPALQAKDEKTRRFSSLQWKN